MAEETLRSYIVTLDLSPGRDPEKISAVFDKTSAALIGFIGSLGTFAGIAYAFEKVANNLRDLYFQSQRTKTTVANLKAAGYAMEQLGGSAQKFQVGFENFARWLRENVGGAGWIGRQLHVPEEIVKGDSVKFYEEVLRRMQSLPQNLQEVWRNRIGTDLATQQAAANPEYAARVAEYAEKAKKADVDFEAAAAAAVKFNQAMGSLVATIELIGDKLVQNLGPDASKLLERFTKWLTDHEENIATAFSYLGEGLLAAINFFGSAMEKAAEWVKWLKNVVDLTGGAHSYFSWLAKQFQWLADKMAELASWFGFSSGQHNSGGGGGGGGDSAAESLPGGGGLGTRPEAHAQEAARLATQKGAPDVSQPVSKGGAGGRVGTSGAFGIEGPQGTPGKAVDEHFGVGGPTHAPQTTGVSGGSGTLPGGGGLGGRTFIHRSPTGGAVLDVPSRDEMASARPKTRIAPGRAGEITGLNPKLKEVMDEASKSLPDGYSIQYQGGLSSGHAAHSEHHTGNATDISIIGPDGRPIGGPHMVGNLGNPQTFPYYEKLYHNVVKAWRRLHPGERDPTWGGYFSGGKSGKSDEMHYDLGPHRGRFGSLETGLYPKHRDKSVHPLHGLEDDSFTFPESPKRPSPESLLENIHQLGKNIHPASVAFNNHGARTSGTIGMGRRRLMARMDQHIHHHKTNINVSVGSGDAAEIAREIQTRQKHINKGLSETMGSTAAPSQATVVHNRDGSITQGNKTFRPGQGMGSP